MIRTQKHRKLGKNHKKKLWLTKPFLLLGALILGLMIMYVGLVVQVALENPASVGRDEGAEVVDEGRPLNERRNQEVHDTHHDKQKTVSKPKDMDSQHETDESNDKAKMSAKGPRGSSKKSEAEEQSNKLPPKPKINKSLPSREVRRPMWMAKPKGFGVKPQVIAGGADQSDVAEDHSDDTESHPDPDHMLKAFVETIDFDEWEQKPLPQRKNAKAEKLYELQYPKLNSCKKLPEKIPADEYTDADTFLPWVHDVFPTHDGKYIQFIAQNRRRCRTGNTPEEIEALHLTQPNIALFQHVPVKRIEQDGETRYKLTTHEDADPDGVATRFICRFKPSMEETLSVYNFDYDYASFRKNNHGRTFQYEDGGIKSVHLTQFLFRCPVPEHLVDIVKSGESVQDDWATLFVDVIPIRTPPRYGRSNEFLQPRYHETLAPEGQRFEPSVEWGNDYILPRIEDSGRWENFPICRPSLQEYYSEEVRSKAVEATNVDERLGVNTEIGPKVHHLVSCMWASAGYTTRGERFAINDGQRRLLEWVHYNKLLGFDHFYLYDNSYAYSSEVTLKPIADLFPDEITYIKWPFQVCNNNPNNVDSPGERSSQYAAEASCRLRFGPHVNWIGQFDMDEYLIPLGSYTSVLPILQKLEETDTKVLSFGSWRAWPRRDLIQEPEPITDRSICDHWLPCFNLQVPMHRTMLQTYNCERQSGPKKDVMPAEKQLYRPDYVRQHFIHYSSVTILSEMNRTEYEKAGYDWYKDRPFPDPKSRFSDEVNEATMLHSKAVAIQDTAGWNEVCKVENYGKGGTCRIGVPYPDNYDEERDGLGREDGFAYNCYVNKKTEFHWVPLLEKAIAEEHGHIFDQE